MTTKQRKTFLNVLFVLLNVIVIVIIANNAFRADTAIDLKRMVTLWLTHWEYALIAIMLPIIALIVEGIKYYQLIDLTTGKKRFILALKTASIGKYYDNVTPLGSGGQAAQVYYLFKNRVSTGKASGITVSAFSMMQVAFSLMAWIVFIFFDDYMTLPGIRIAAYIGSVFAIFIPILVILFSLSSKHTSQIIFNVLKILRFLRLIKNPINTMKRIITFLKRFKHNLRLIFQQKNVMIRMFVLSFLYHLAIFSIPYFVVKASGIDVQYIEIIVLSVFVYNAIAFIPTPGNSGGAEISFTIIFSMLTGGLLFWTMLFWRFVSYYFFIIVGLFVMMYDTLIKKQQTISIQD